MPEIAPGHGTGMMDEHETRGNDAYGKGADYDPTPEDKKTLKMVQKLFEEAKRHRSQYDDKWLDYYKMFRGKQWKESRPSYRHSEVINLVFRTIQSMVPIQVDARPRFEFMPQEPSDMPFATLLNQLADADWTKKNWSDQLLEVVYDANIYGTGLSSMTVKEELGQPTIVYESQDPFYSFPDPNAKDTNKDCGYFIDAEPTDIRIIKRKYPDKKQYIKSDIQDLLKGSKTDMAPLRYRNPAETTSTSEGGSLDNIDKNRALLITCWIRPDFPELLEDYEEIEKTNPETLEISYEQHAKWPNGRKIVVCNNILLEDSPIGYDDSKIPFSRYPNYMLPREFWGMSEVEQLEGPQKTFNKLVSFVLDVLTLMGNPIWKVHSASGVDPENLTTRPGLVIEWDGEPGTEPKREEGVQLQPYVLQVIDRMGEWFDSIGGTQDVTRGATPGGVTAASAITSLQEAAQTRIRQKSRNLDGYLQSVGQQWVSRTLQFTTAPQVYRLTNDQNATQFFKMRIEHYTRQDGSEGKRALVESYNENGQMDPQSGLSIYEIAGEFDVKVSTGSALPFAKAEKEAKLNALFDRGIIDAFEVLKQGDYPNYQAVIDRMQQQAQAAAQAEMAAKAGPAPLV